MAVKQTIEPEPDPAVPPNVSDYAGARRDFS